MPPLAGVLRCCGASGSAGGQPTNLPRGICYCLGQGYPKLGPWTTSSPPTHFDQLADPNCLMCTHKCVGGVGNFLELCEAAGGGAAHAGGVPLGTAPPTPELPLKLIWFHVIPQRSLVEVSQSPRLALGGALLGHNSACP